MLRVMNSTDRLTVNKCMDEWRQCVLRKKSWSDQICLTYTKMCLPHIRFLLYQPQVCLTC